MKEQASKKTMEKKKPLRGPSKFRKTEATRLMRATIAAGFSIARIDVDPHTGKISVVPRDPLSDSSVRQLNR